jgi:hypothetical protein
MTTDSQATAALALAQIAQIVIRGLDPRIHLSSAKLFSSRMDCRVRPGNDKQTRKQTLRWPSHKPYKSSYAGLTRVSIYLHKDIIRRMMDCRVKPGNDEESYDTKQESPPQ